MKKKLFYITGACALLALQTACSPQFEDLFDKSASERLEEAMDDAESVLTAADKGWAMGYFPNTETRGYVLFAKFNTDGTVTLTDYNNGGLSSTSTYSMNTSQGPVLNFDTYSEVLGRYTDPGTWLGGSTGNAGDFEFVIFSVNEDEVILKGKKYHAKVVLRKITGDGDQETLWRQYYDQCEAMYGKLFASGVSPVLTVGTDTVYRFENAVSRSFEMYPYGSNNPEEMTPLSYVASITGIDLAENLEVNGKPVRSFRYDETLGTLISQEDATVQIVAPEVYSHMRDSELQYLAGADGVFGKFKTGFDALSAGFTTQYGGNRDLETVGFVVNEDVLHFVLNTTRNEAVFTLPGAVQGDKLVIDAFDASNFPSDDMDNNAALFYQQVAVLRDFLALLPGEYALVNTGQLSVASIEMASISSADDSFLLQRN